MMKWFGELELVMTSCLADEIEHSWFLLGEYYYVRKLNKLEFRMLREKLEKGYTIY